MGMGGGGFAERPIEETVINNNYYDDPNRNSGGLDERREHETSFDDRSGDGVQLHDASYVSGGDSLDDSREDSLDNDQTLSGSDDSSSFDDGGGFDSGDDSNVV